MKKETMRIKQKVARRKFSALSNLQDYLLPELRIKKTKQVIQLLPHTKNMMDIDTLIEVDSEAEQYKEWERKRKNEILAMHDSQKKQQRWNELFPRSTQDDSYIFNGVVY
jgi:hypothetical protein